MLGLRFIASVDPNPIKRRKALEMGADAVFAPDDPDLSQLTGRLGRSLDSVIDAVGKVEIMNTALSMIKMAGNICVYGVIDTPAIRLKKIVAHIISTCWCTNGLRGSMKPPLRSRSAGGSKKVAFRQVSPIGRVSA